MQSVSPLSTLRLFLVAIALVATLANAAGPAAIADANDVPDLAFGFAQRCVEKGVNLKRLEVIACNSQKLRAQEKTMLDIVAAAREETSGVDGETGDIIDPLPKEQDGWRQGVERRCKDALCLSKAYTARISQLREDWWDALPEALRD
ncbi:hypothetical protein [Pseudomonas marginalis]|uniref:hypothetical protein n=1 Tax=Pseudomonas marginalis TaxID=298 RepID=UPI0005FAC70F|nr:hypothetical protein [Pseudomonas marginalis]KJZ52968.1 hypothetical protein VC37_17440 [Pseudomonas marginalis]KJZ54198.1 hypothetical protein VC36_25110 [Pseudomonas marginalis]